MNPIICQICEKTNHTPDGSGVVVATFPSMTIAKEALFAIESAHILPVWCKVFSKEEIGQQNDYVSESDALILQLHGIKDVVNLEMLYIESICRERNALTVDTISTRKSCEKFLQHLS